MPHVVLYHNPKCSKSRGALELLQARDLDLEIIEYLDTPPDRAALESILDKLPDPPADLVRKDAHFKDLALDPDAYTTRPAVVDLLLKHPRLMQRPIAIQGHRALIARPSDRVLDLLEHA